MFYYMLMVGSGHFFASCSSPEHSSRTILRLGKNLSKYEVNNVKYKVNSNYVLRNTATLNSYAQN